jgi:hypothetical protein
MDIQDENTLLGTALTTDIQPHGHTLIITPIQTRTMAYMSRGASTGSMDLKHNHPYNIAELHDLDTNLISEGGGANL